jgi:hypothetical protein
MGVIGVLGLTLIIVGFLGIVWIIIDAARP